MPLLWWPHDRHRDLRALAPAPRSTIVFLANRGLSVVTRHDQILRSPATTTPRLTNPSAPISIVVATAHAGRCDWHPFATLWYRRPTIRPTQTGGRNAGDFTSATSQNPLSP